MKTLFTLFTTIFLAGQTAFAQTPDTANATPQTVYTAGIKGGINAAIVSNLVASEVYLGWHGGVFGSVQVRESVGVGSEINFSSQGVTVSNIDIRLNYLNLPVYLNLYTGPVTFQAGGYWAYLLSAKALNGEVKKDVANFFQDNDYGLVVGFNFSPGQRTFLGARFNMGFRNINNHLVEPAGADLRNRNIQLSGGYRF